MDRLNNLIFLFSLDRNRSIDINQEATGDSSSEAAIDSESEKMHFKSNRLPQLNLSLSNKQRSKMEENFAALIGQSFLTRLER